MFLTDDAEGHGVLGGASSVPHHHRVGARVGRAGLRHLQAAVSLTAADGDPLPSDHHLTERQVDRQTDQ